MLLVANHCNGGFSYQGLGQEYNNPFIWSYTPIDSLCNIIKHFYDINWTNISLHRSKDTHLFDTYFKDSVLLEKTFFIDVDGKGVISYPHYRLDLQYNTPTKVNYVDIHSKDIYKYVVDCYLRRVKRMCLTHKRPIIYFLACNHSELDAAADIQLLCDKMGIDVIGLDTTAQHNLNIVKKYNCSVDMSDPDCTKKASEEAIPFLRKLLFGNTYESA